MKLKKNLCLISMVSVFYLFSVNAQNADFSDSVFSDDVFSEDFLFADDGIVDYEDTKGTEENSALNHGTLFETGSIKLGGNFSTSLSTLTTVWNDSYPAFTDSLKDTVLTPKAEAFLYVDARPTQILRLYTKFGFAYPFKDYGMVNGSALKFYDTGLIIPVTGTASITNWFKLKELFTDFSAYDRFFFRFGFHTVSWGTGYFYSPVSDMINTSSIDPENVSEQVDGAFNLRMQVTFPGSQNCLWFYVIPSTDFINAYSADSYLRDTAVAGKADLVFGNWEIGVGAFYKYETSPKAMLTASGAIGKVNFFGEAVYQYGSQNDWLLEPDDWSGKESIFLLTCGITYYWKTPEITVAAQYYYDSNDVEFNGDALNSGDAMHTYFTSGHNFAALANFGRIFGTQDVTATVFVIANYGKKDLPDLYKNSLASSGISSSLFSAMTVSALLNYSPFKNFTFGAGPYVTWQKITDKPEVALKLTATLGGGKF